MANLINVSDFRNNISDYLNRVLYHNESFLLKKGKRIIAKVTGYNKSEEVLTEDKIKKYAGILNDSEAKKVKKQMKKFRKKFKLLA